jgi:hypothetical protein
VGALARGAEPREAPEARLLRALSSRARSRPVRDRADAASARAAAASAAKAWSSASRSSISRPLSPPASLTSDLLERTSSTVSSTSDDAIVTGRAHAGASELSTVPGEATVRAAAGVADETIVSGELAETVAADEVATVPDEIDVAIVREVGVHATELRVGVRLITC